MNREWGMGNGESGGVGGAVAAGIPPAVEGGVSPPGIPAGSRSVSRSISNQGIPMSKGPSWDSSVCLFHVVPPAPGPTFQCSVPPTWKRLPLLSEEPDYSDPTTWMPLGTFMADAGSMILTIASRPAYDTGSPAQWLPYLCRQMGFDYRNSAPISLHGRAAVASCHASQATSRGPMSMRLAIVEDRGHWVLLTVMSVASLWAEVEPAFLTLLETFELHEVPTPEPSRADLRSVVPFPVLPQNRHAERTETREVLRPTFCFATT
jgi:hypothetical protein